MRTVVVASKMLKLQLIYLTLCSLSQAAYISRVATLNRIRAPTAFRPGVNLHRPWMHQRLVPAASHRVPYVVYRGPPQRYAVRHFGPTAHRNVFPQHGWKTTSRLPPPTTEYEFVRAASSPPAVHNDGGTGAIHTIPAPNLSLSEKPIVVMDSDNFIKPTPSPVKTYEVTEKFIEPAVYQMSPKIEVPVGFSKQTTLTSPEFQSLVRNGALQFASDYGLSIAMQQPAIQVPQQYTMQGFNGLPTQQDLINSGADGIVINPHALYQADPTFLQKLQTQLMQQFPSVEFIPYPADTQPIHQQQPQPQIQQNVQNHLFLLENQEITRQPPASFELPKNVVQRQAHESAVMSLIPQPLTVRNVTENQIEVTSASAPQNVTVELLTAPSQPSTTTVKYIIESTTQEQNTKSTTKEHDVTPIYYAQVGQSIGNVVANGFYSAINDVRAAAALAQVEKPQEPENQTTTTINPDIKAYFVQQSSEDNKNNTVELKPLLGVPFTKTADSVNIAYTLLRANHKEPKVTKEGAVYAGQIVEAKISEDQDFNKEKATLITRRAPLRILTVTEKKDVVTSTSVPPKITVVKAKIPPKSKLTFDDKTGEPVLRIYASYVNPPVTPKEILTTKLNNIKNVKEIVVKKPDGVENWTSAMVKKAEQGQGRDVNQVTDFGLKLRSRSDDYIPLFEDYEE